MYNNIEILYINHWDTVLYQNWLSAFIVKELPLSKCTYRCISRKLYYSKPQVCVNKLKHTHKQSVKCHKDGMKFEWNPSPLASCRANGCLLYPANPPILPYQLSCIVVPEGPVFSTSSSHCDWSHRVWLILSVFFYILLVWMSVLWCLDELVTSMPSSRQPPRQEIAWSLK